ncbi:MAG: lipoyl(octanoyl) transferase LipB [Bacteroidota bacterium]
MTNQQTVFLQDLGLRPYQQTWDLQEQLLQENVATKLAAKANGIEAPVIVNTTNHLLLLEHPPVYTLGKTGHEEYILISEADRVSKGIEYYRINRGGDITFHGPGQLVGYPIIDLELFFTDIGKYLRYLEEVIIKTIAVFGIAGERSKGETGVWLDTGIKGSERKICAMGVRCSRWITMHGWALNVNTDMSYFDHIIPCGIAEKKVTSMQQELGRTVNMNEVKSVLVEKFSEVFDVEIKPGRPPC